MKKEKYFLIAMLSSVLLVLLSAGALNYYCDPLQIFNSTKYGNGEQRYINYGIARNHKYDGVVIGTSTSENILKKDLKEILGINAVNLASEGSTSYEHRELLKEIIKNKNLKNVIYGLDIFSYNSEIDAKRLEIPEYIKSPYQISVLKNFFNFLTFKNSIQEILKNKVSKDEKNWIDNHSYWGDNYSYSKEKTLNFDPNTQYGAQNLGVIKTMKTGYPLVNMKNNFDLFLELTQENKDIQYVIYFPPYAFLFWSFMQKYDYLNTALEFKKYIFSRTASTNNIKIYDFQNDFETIENLDNYKDMVHYGPKINKEILELIKDNQYIETLESHEKNVEIFKTRVLEWKQNYSQILNQR
ncbi:MAG: hypothetical protein ACRC54_02825 [Fusobacteriaceae bacterium]